MFTVNSDGVWCLQQDMLPVTPIHTFMLQNAYSKKLSLAYAGCGSARDGKRTDDAIEAFFVFQRTPTDPLSLRMIQMFQDENFVSIQFQVPVFDQRKRVGTYLDALAFDTDGYAVIIENKTGYDHAYGAPAKFNFQNSKIKDSIPNRHLLQAALGASIYAQMHPHQSVRAMVFIVNSTSLQCGAKWHVPTDIMNYAAQLLDSPQSSNIHTNL